MIERPPTMAEDSWRLAANERQWGAASEPAYLGFCPPTRCHPSTNLDRGTHILQHHASKSPNGDIVKAYSIGKDYCKGCHLLL